MNRNTINIKDIALNEEDNDLININEWDTIELISQETISYDLEDDSATIICIFKYLEDNKFYRFEYTDSEESDILEQTAIEVFPEQILTTIYK